MLRVFLYVVVARSAAFDTRGVLERCDVCVYWWACFIRTCLKRCIVIAWRPSTIVWGRGGEIHLRALASRVLGARVRSSSHGRDVLEFLCPRTLRLPSSVGGTSRVSIRIE